MEASSSPQFSQHQRPGPTSRTPGQAWRSWLYIGLMIIAAGVAAYVIWWAAEETTSQQIQLAESVQSAPKTAAKSVAPPELAVEVLLTGRDHIWDIGFLPDKTPIFTERSGLVNALKGDKVAQLAKPGDVVSTGGEGGMLGLAVDPQFSENRYIYTCFNTNHGDVRVVRWRINADVTALEDRKDIITGIPEIPGGRHSGCRVAFGPDSYLWVGTGDSAQNDVIPQSPTSLGGKILRVDRDGKAAASGNMGGAFDPRIFSYGHRNTQGIAFYPRPVKGVVGVSIEHGSTVDDEVNLLVNGNFGWSPKPGYNEQGVPMTDKTRFPDAIDAIWSSGGSTIAPSGATFLKGGSWKAWEGRLAMAVLKDRHLRLLQFDQNKLVSQEEIFKNEFGRIRTAMLGPENALYLTTDNGGDDKIVRITPK